MNTCFLVRIASFNGQRICCTQQCGTTTSNNTFFNSSTCCIQSIINTVFLFFHFNFCCTTHADNSNTTSEFSKSFLQFLTVIVRSCFFDLSLDLIDASSNFRLLSSTINNGGVFFRNVHFLCTSKHIQSDIFKFNAHIFRNNLSGCQDCDIL